MHDTPKRDVFKLRDVFKFWEISDKISETVQDRDMVAIATIWHICGHYYQWPWVTLKVTLAIWILSNSRNLGNVVCIIYYMFTHESETVRGLQFQLSFFENEGIPKVTGTFHCKVNVVISGKRCKIDSLLLQRTNRKWCMAYWIAEIPMTLSDL